MKPPGNDLGPSMSLAYLDEAVAKLDKWCVGRLETEPKLRHRKEGARVETVDARLHENGPKIMYGGT